MAKKPTVVPQAKKERKIALIGSAPSSIRQAPYNDPSWEIWGCSPGAYGVVPRSDMWFELHRYEPGQTWFSPEYCQFLAKHKKVVVAEHRLEIPNGFTMDIEYLTKKYTPYFFTSSVAWMMALAIEEGATKIGLWGVDMAANEEYGDQRAGLHFFALIAQQLGIEVGTPPESDLFRPRRLYGVDEIKHGNIKLLARERELQARIADAANRKAQAEAEYHFLSGARDDLKYCTETWRDPSSWTAPAPLDFKLIE